MRQFIIFFSMLFCGAAPAFAEASAGQLYEDCTASHIPAPARKPADWVKLRRCENIIDGAIKQLKWPLQATSVQTGWQDSSHTNDRVICPVDRAVYLSSYLVSFYMEHWDQKGMGFIQGKVLSASDSVIEAMTARFPACAAAGKK